MKDNKKALCVALASIFALAPFALSLMLKARANDKKPVVLAFGDSITASGRWFSESEKLLGTRIINKAVGGWNSKEGRAAFDNAISVKPDIMLLSFGMNDSAFDMAKYVPLEDYVDNMRYMITTAQKKGIKVILVIENPIGADDYYTRHDKTAFEPYGGICNFYYNYVEAARNLAKEYNLVYMDMFDIFSSQDDYNKFLQDGVHPNDRGYKLYERALAETIIKRDIGDVNGDGKITAKDYIMLRLAILGYKKLDDESVRCADLNGNGKIDPQDYIKLRQKLLKQL